MNITTSRRSKNLQKMSTKSSSDKVRKIYDSEKESSDISNEIAEVLEDETSTSHLNSEDSQYSDQSISSFRISEKNRKIVTEEAHTWSEISKIYMDSIEQCYRTLENDFKEMYDLSHLKQKVAKIDKHLLIVENVQPGVNINWVSNGKSNRQLSRGFVEFSIPSSRLELFLPESCKRSVMIIVSLNNIEVTEKFMSECEFAYSSPSLVDNFRNYVFFGDETSFIDFRFPKNENILIKANVSSQYIVPVLLSSEIINGEFALTMTDWYSDSIQSPLHCISHKITVDKLRNIVKLIVIDNKWCGKEDVLDEVLNVLKNIDIDL